MSYVIAQSEQRANKEHDCDWCGLAISKGDIYYKWTDTYDVISTGKMHMSCRTDAELCADDRECLSDYEDERSKSREEMIKKWIPK